jgi:MFS superfamily sulfate permease-like transporter
MSSLKQCDPDQQSDSTGLRSNNATKPLAALHAELERQGVVFAMTRVKQDLRNQLAKAGLIDTLGADHIFMTLPTAVAAYRNWHQQRVGPLPDDSIPGPAGTP